MLKTILTIIQEYRREQNLPVPLSLVGSSDPDDIQIFNLVHSVCEELRTLKCWRQCIRTHTFDTEANRSKYLLPADFYSPVLRTYWNRDEDIRLDGPVTDDEFHWIVQGHGSTSVNYTFRIVGWDNNRSTEGGQFEITETAAGAGVTLSFDYVTRHLFLPSDWAASTAYTTDDYVNVNGNIYKCSSNGTSSAADPPSGTGTGIIDGTAQWDWYNTPIELAPADDYLCLYDYDLVKLGLRARDFEAKGVGAEKAEAMFRRRIDTAINRYKGKYLGSFSRRRSYPGLRIPYKSWDI